MHIVHVIGYMRPDKGGAQAIIREIVKLGNTAESSAFSHSVFALFQSGDSPPGVFHAGLNKWMSPITASAVLKKAVQRNNARLLHIHSPAVGYIARRVAKRLDIPTVTTVHTYPQRYPALLVLLDKRTLGYDSVTVGVSDAVTKAVRRYAGSDKMATRTIYNGIEMEKWRAVCKKRVSLNSTLYTRNPQQVVKIAAVGSLNRNKGWDVLLEAVALLAKEGRSVQVDFIGAGDEQDNLEQYASTLGIASTTKFWGGSLDVPIYFAHCDLAVFPSRCEGFGLAFLEAVVSGIPVVASRLEPFREIFTECRHFVEPNNSKALASEIEAVAQALLSESQAAMQAAPTVERRFQADTMVNAYTALYAEVLGTS